MRSSRSRREPNAEPIASGEPAGRYDLLTALMHEMHHVLGRTDSSRESDANGRDGGDASTGCSPHAYENTRNEDHKRAARAKGVELGRTVPVRDPDHELRAFAPKGWALCNGQLLPINQNQALFSLLGTTFGGDGRVNFALPDLRGRTPIHVGSGHTLGERGGEQAHTLSIAELPDAHARRAARRAATRRRAVPAGNVLLADAHERRSYGRPANLVGAEPGTVANVGGSQAHLNMQPFLTLSFCIALQGIFPSPN